MNHPHEDLIPIADNRTLQATITLVDGADFEGAVPSGQTMRIGGKRFSASEDTGFRPLETLLLSIGACSGILMRECLREGRQEISAFQITLVGQKSAGVPSVFSVINLEFILTGKMISKKAVQESLKLTKKNCSVMAMLHPSIVVETRFRIVEK